MSITAKRIGFTPEVVPLILSGEKTVTYRVNDSKDIQVGDELLFANSDSGEEFGTACVRNIKYKPIKDIGDSDYAEGHESYESTEAFVKQFQDFYGDKINKYTEIKMISYDFKPTT